VVKAGIKSTTSPLVKLLPLQTQQCRGL